MTQFQKVEGLDMLRDTTNMSLINKNKSELEGYLNKRKVMMEQKKEINSIKEEVSGLKDDISEIKNLLLQLSKR